MSKQSKWQKRKRLEGKCPICGQPAVNKSYCQRHRVETNRMWRIRNIKQNFAKGFIDEETRDLLLKMEEKTKIS